MAKQKRVDEREERFAREYVVDLNGTQAAFRCGFGGRRPDVIASKMLARKSVQAKVAVLQAARAKRTDVDANYVIDKIRTQVERCEGSGNSDGVYKGAHLLGAHLGMWKQVNEHTGKDGAPLNPPPPPSVTKEEFRDIARELIASV